MGRKEEEATASREYTLARLAAARGALASASTGLDEALILFVTTEDDKKGSKRAALLEAIDEAIGIAAIAIQAAQGSWEGCDPAEGEPVHDDEEEDDDEAEDEDDEED
jgi:hypothetical protein